MKTCSKCGVEKPVEDFQTRNGKPISRCRACVYQRQRDYHAANLEQRRAAKKANASKHKGRLAAYLKQKGAELRQAIIIALGGSCSCCGEHRCEFLAIDHIHGGGRQERKSGSGITFYRKVVKAGIPRDKYRLLCHNCNMSHGLYGYCPHQAVVTLHD